MAQLEAFKHCTVPSTYDLFATSPAFTGAGTFGGAENVFVPVIVSAFDRCTTALSFAFVASAEFTYCIDTGCAAVPDPGVVTTCASVTGDVDTGTIQNSVFTVPGPNW